MTTKGNEYLVKWRDRPDHDNTWVSKKDLLGHEELTVKFVKAPTSKSSPGTAHQERRGKSVKERRATIKPSYLKDYV